MTAATAAATTGLRDRALAAVRAAARRAPVEGDDAWRAAAVTAALAEAVGGGDDDLVLALADGYGAVLMSAPRRLDGTVELVGVGVTERRRRGAFATPPALARVLAAHALPHPVAAAGGVAAPRVVDPACGTGALLVAALERLVSLGQSATQALSCLYGVDADPVAVRLCRAALVVRARRLGAEPDLDRLAAQVVVGDALVGATPAGPSVAEPAQVGDLVWHDVFAEVLAVAGDEAEPVTGWRGGFDAVVANPPWERLKVFAREETGAGDGAWDDERSRRAGNARRLRDLGRHPLTVAGEVNAYLPFVETCWRLLAPQGRAALVVPAGIAADRGAARLWQQLLATEALERVHLLDQVALFEQVSARVGVAVVVLRHGVPRTPTAAAGRTAEVIVGVADAAAPPSDRAWPLDAATARLVNPNTATLPLFGCARDAELVTAAHRRHPVLRRRDPRGEVVSDPWQLRLVSSLHMTRDSRWFASTPGPGLVPLWEAKHAGLLDPYGGVRAVTRYWVPAELMVERFPDLMARGWLGVYRNITTTDSPRTLVPCALPPAGVGNSLPLLSAPRLPLLLAVLASLPVDYLVRQKHAGANLNFFKLEQVALPAPQAYDVAASWQPDVTVGEWLLDAFARAHTWDDGLSVLAAELGAAGVTVPGRSLPVLERRRALADLDAAQAVLLGWTEADLAHVLASFPALARRESRSDGPRTDELVTTAFRRLSGR